MGDVLNSSATDNDSGDVCSRPVPPGNLRSDYARGPVAAGAGRDSGQHHGDRRDDKKGSFETSVRPCEGARMANRISWTRNVTVSLLVLDAAAVLFGTFMAWIVIGISEFDSARDAPGWLPPAVIVLGVFTASLMLYLARRLTTSPTRIRVAGVLAIALHLALALATVIALGSLLGAAVLVIGAAIAAIATNRPPQHRAVAKP